MILFDYVFNYLVSRFVFFAVLGTDVGVICLVVLWALFMPAVGGKSTPAPARGPRHKSETNLATRPLSAMRLTRKCCNASVITLGERLLTLVLRRRSRNNSSASFAIPVDCKNNAISTCVLSGTESTLFAMVDRLGSRTLGVVRCSYSSLSSSGAGLGCAVFARG